MNLPDFFDAIEQDKILCGVNINFDRQEITVRDQAMHVDVVVKAEHVERHDWPTLRGKILGIIDAEPLNHMTRVVGYYSRVDNWNKSKVGELKDRHKGQYAITE